MYYNIFMQQQKKFVSDRIVRILGRTPETITLLPEGITHRNYLIDNLYVYKWKSPGRQPFYNADADFHANTLMNALGHAPKIIYFSSTDYEIVYEYYANTSRLSWPISDEMLKEVINTLELLHSSNVHVDYEFNLGKMITYYLDHGAVPFHDKAFEQTILAAYQTYNDASKKVLSHNDVVIGNLLFQGNHLILIDYEYAGMNDPLFDHISFLSENNLDTMDFMTRYFSFVKEFTEPLDLHKVETYLFASDLLWYYWGGYLFALTNETIFKQISDEKAARINARRHHLSNK